MRKPLQVYVDEGELARLEAWSRKHGRTKSDAVRAAIRALTRPAGEDPLLEMVGMVQGLPPDASERFDHYVQETYVAERRPRHRRSRPRVRR